MEVLIFIVMLVVIAALAIYQYYRNQQRKNDLLALAARHGWTFMPHKDYAMETRFGAFGCLQQGANRYGYNILEGAYGDRGICAFDYHYETYSTDSKGNLFTVESAEGKRLQRFVFRGVETVTRDQGVRWPR